MRESRVLPTVAVETVRNKQKGVTIRSIIVTSNNSNFKHKLKDGNEKQHYTRRYLI